jgi:four helix bundle protein
MAYQDFTEMPVWKLAFDLLLNIYNLSKTFPTDERFGLISDLRRSANSIVHNIAEGFGRFEAKDKTRFYKISRGSAYELISQILVAHALSYITDDIQKMN